MLNNTQLAANNFLAQGGSQFAPVSTETGDNFVGSGSHVLLVDSDTSDRVTQRVGSITTGFLNGFTAQQMGNRIRVDQGLDTTEVSPSLILDPELKENQYIVEVDSRFMKIYDPISSDTPIAQPSFIDDDSIASYYFTINVGKFVENATTGPTSGNNENTLAKSNAEVIRGPRGTHLILGLLASTDLVSSDYLFNTLGSSFTETSSGNYEGGTFDFIDTTIRVTGVTTGYRLDIPLRILKLRN